MKQNKTSPGFLRARGCVCREMCLLAGCGREGGEKKDLIFMSHWGLYGEVNPRVLCRGWCLGFCQFQGGDEQLSGAAHAQWPLYQPPNTPSLSAQPLSQSSSCVCRPDALTSITHTHTYYKLFKWALCLLLGRVNRESGGEGRQRGRVLGESEEGVQMNRGAAVKCSD